MRYSVSISPFGYEPNPNSRLLRYAVVDNRPDAVSVWDAREQQKVLFYKPSADCPPWRHVAYCAHQEDAENLAKAMNRATMPKELQHRVTASHNRESADVDNKDPVGYT